MDNYNPIDSSKEQLPPEWREILYFFSDTHENIFIAGKAGTGKTTLLKLIKATCTHKKTIILAYTGLAAINADGQTIHSFCGFRPPLINPTLRRNRELYRRIDAILIDEISMVRADLLDGLDRFMRLNGRDRELPFGGAQVVLCGDVFQLEPITRTDEKEFHDLNYSSHFFWDSHVFPLARFKPFELETVYRQKDDPEYLSILNRVRTGKADSSDLETINSRIVSHQQRQLMVPTITLTALTDTAYRINYNHLSRIPGAPFEFRAVLSGKYLDKNKDWLNKNLPCDLNLILKPGAFVIFIKNDPEKRWVNGTPGRVEKITQEGITVSIDSQIKHLVCPVTWEACHVKYNKETGDLEKEVIAAVTQYPLQLAWAITIHKSQGLTFERIHIDMEGGAWGHGQTYVALSRCRTLSGLSMSRPIFKNDLIVDKKVVDFYTASFNK